MSWGPTANLRSCHRYRKEIPELLYCSVWWRHQSWSSNWGYSGFCQPHTQKQTQTKCVHNLHALCGVSHMFILTLRPQYIRTWLITVILIFRKKPEYPQLEPHAAIKMAQVLGSLVYICGSCRVWYTVTEFIPLTVPKQYDRIIVMFHHNLWSTLSASLHKGWQ